MQQASVIVEESDSLISDLTNVQNRFHTIRRAMENMPADIRESEDFKTLETKVMGVIQKSGGLYDQIEGAQLAAKDQTFGLEEGAEPEHDIVAWHSSNQNTLSAFEKAAGILEKEFQDLKSKTIQ